MARPEFYTWRGCTGKRIPTRTVCTRIQRPIPSAPCRITTADEIDDPNDLYVTGRLNDDVFTQDHTGNYRFSIQRCIAEASQHFTLRPGDLLSFGTTGKGNDKFPRGHKSVLIGQQQGAISIEIEPLGRLENPIRHQKGGA